MKFASLEVNLSLGQDLSVNIIILFKEDPKHDWIIVDLVVQPINQSK